LYWKRISWNSEVEIWLKLAISIYNLPCEELSFEIDIELIKAGIS